MFLFSLQNNSKKRKLINGKNIYGDNSKKLIN